MRREVSSSDGLGIVTEPGSCIATSLKQIQRENITADEVFFLLERRPCVRDLFVRDAAIIASLRSGRFAEEEPSV